MTRPWDGVRFDEGTLDAAGLRVAIVVARYNDIITERLLDGALEQLRRMGARPQDVHVVRVSGAYELPGAVELLLQRGEVQAVAALGCLLRGDTIHFDLIAGEVTRGLGASSRAHGIPVALGVITADTLEQAMQRAGAKAGNKGAESVAAAVEQARLYERLRA
jgi:6,7-dimethyl-8-ribityllumazine synthase